MSRKPAVAVNEGTFCVCRILAVQPVLGIQLNCTNALFSATSTWLFNHCITNLTPVPGEASPDKPGRVGAEPNESAAQLSAPDALPVAHPHQALNGALHGV